MDPVWALNKEQQTHSTSHISLYSCWKCCCWHSLDVVFICPPEDLKPPNLSTMALFHNDDSNYLQKSRKWIYNFKWFQTLCGNVLTFNVMQLNYIDCLQLSLWNTGGNIRIKNVHSSFMVFGETKSFWVDKIVFVIRDYKQQPSCLFNFHISNL